MSDPITEPQNGVAGVRKDFPWGTRSGAGSLCRALAKVVSMSQTRGTMMHSGGMTGGGV